MAMMPNEYVPAASPVNVYGEVTPDAVRVKSDCAGDAFVARYASYVVAFVTAPHVTTCDPFVPPAVDGFVVVPRVTVGVVRATRMGPISVVRPSSICKSSMPKSIAAGVELPTSTMVIAPVVPFAVRLALVSADMVDTGPDVSVGLYTAQLTVDAVVGFVASWCSRSSTRYFVDAVSVPTVGVT